MDFRDYIKELVDQVSENVGARTVFGESRKIGDKVVIPVAQVSYGGGGGGGFGHGPEEEKAGGGTGGGGGLSIKAKPLGVIVVTEDDVAWMPTPDVTRVVIAGCLVAVAALMSFRAMASG